MDIFKKKTKCIHTTYLNTLLELIQIDIVCLPLTFDVKMEKI